MTKKIDIEELKAIISKEELYDLYITQNKNKQELLEYYDLSLREFHAILKFYEINKANILQKLPNISKEQLYEDYVLNNLTKKQLSKKYNILESKVIKLLKTYNIDKYNTCCKKVDKIDKNVLEDLYLNKNYNVQEVANFFNVSTSTIIKFNKLNNTQKSNKQALMKSHQTYKERTGYDIPAKNPKVMDKMRETCYKKYDAPSPLQSVDIEQKIKQSNLEKYGVENPFQSKKIQDKIKQTNLKRYGVENASQDPDIIKKGWKTKKERGTVNTSKPEEEIARLLQTKFKIVLRNHCTEKYPFHCDFYIPELDLYIEYQGTFDHGVRSKNKIYGPYDPNNLEHQAVLKKWKERADNGHPRYLQAIDTWTVRDPLKRETAKKNNLNWIEFFTFHEFLDWFNALL